MDIVDYTFMDWFVIVIAIVTLVFLACLIIAEVRYQQRTMAWRESLKEYRRREWKEKDDEI